MQAGNRCADCGFSKRYAQNDVITKRRNEFKNLVYCTENKRGVNYNGICELWVPRFGVAPLTQVAHLLPLAKNGELDL